MTTPAQSPSAEDSRFGAIVLENPVFACPLCGQLHTRIPLRPGDSIRCVRCDSLLATGRASSWQVTLAWVLTGLILWVPANLLPVVTVSQLGNSHHSLIISGAVSVWHHGMPWVAVLVVLCGIAAPLILLLSLTLVLTCITLGRPAAPLRFVLSWLRMFELWSLPEVFLLAVLVALIKLGALVHHEPGAGLWCCAAMSFALVIAWRRFDIDAAAAAFTGEGNRGPIT